MAKKMHSRWTPDEVRHITAGGREARADDEWFEDTLQQWEHEGVDVDLVYLARPLFEGTAKQQALAAKMMSKVRDEYMDSISAQQRIVRLLAQEGLGMGHIPRVTAEEFNDAWDEFSGDLRRNGVGNVSFGGGARVHPDAIGAEPGDRS